MDRDMLKNQARDRMDKARPKPVVTGIFFVLITIAISFMTTMLMGDGPAILAEKYFGTDPSTFNYAEFIENFNYDAFMADYVKYQPGPTADFLSFALRIMSMIITTGLIIFCLNTLRGSEETSHWNLFDGFSIFGRVFLLYFLEGIFILLWAMLFIFPAFIAYYRYSQAIYLLIDHPEMSPYQCLMESARIMSGHKWERFVLDLSFIGWILLIVLFSTIGIMYNVSFVGTLIGIWLYPFYHLTAAGYYRTLVGDDIPENDGWTPDI